jgi:hypothetical protein
MTRRKTIGENPLDAVVPDPQAPKIQGRVKVESAEAEPERSARATKVVKERLTVHLPIALIERMRNAVYWTPGMTLASLAEDAIQHAVDRLEKTRGKPFDPRKGRVRPGRPPR